MTTQAKYTILQLASTVAFITALIFAYAAYAEHSAGQTAMRFCSSVRVGSRVEQIVTSATQSGANRKYTHWRMEQDHDWLQVIFTGFTPLSRHVCAVESINSKVVNVRYSYLD